MKDFMKKDENCCIKKAVCGGRVRTASSCNTGNKSSVSI